MGREIRRVPADWDHPKDERGNFIPKYDESYEEAIEEWYKEHHLWIKGEHPDQEGGTCSEYQYWADWHGDAPELEFYRRRKWVEEDETHFQVYETVSEGTPLTPVLPSLADVVNYLCTEGDYWGYVWGREAAEQFVSRGFAFSLVAVRDAHGTRVMSPHEQVLPDLDL